MQQVPPPIKPNHSVIPENSNKIINGNPVLEAWYNKRVI
jgi:hypothetical protein